MVNKTCLSMPQVLFKKTHIHEQVGVRGDRAFIKMMSDSTPVNVPLRVNNPAKLCGNSEDTPTPSLEIQGGNLFEELC